MCGVALFAVFFMRPVAWAQSQQGKPTVVPDAVPHEERPASLKVPPLQAPLRLADFAGMHPSSAVKDHLLEIEGFRQSQPNDGLPATQKTEAYMGYTPTTLYVAFLCFDSRPQSIRGHMARRENVTTDDNVSILLDPFQDHRRGVLFQVNPFGVQADAAYTESNGTDYSYDQVWDSAGRVTAQGWMAVLAIPFRSLRFHAGAQQWGVVLTRNLPRNSETDHWPHIATSIQGMLTQEGTLRGIEGVTGSHNLQLNPYGLVQRERALDQRDPDNPYFSDRKFEGTAGGDAKAILKDSIVVDATVNPDFSQVESDQPQFTVNQRYPVYFPELRPFFLENANYFSTPINLLYTRNIVHPEFGARVTGKVGGTNVGILAIDDRSEGETYGPNDPEYGKHAFFGVGRVTQDLGKGSSLGGIFTDYQFAGSNNRIGGLDYTARLNESWTSNGQMVESSTKETDGRYAAGPASYVELDRNGHSFNLNTNYQDISTGFQSVPGFITTSDIRQGNEHATYRWYRTSGLLQSIGLENNVNIGWDHQGNRVLRYLQFDPFFLLARNTTLAPILLLNSDTVGPQDGYALAGNRNFAENQIGVVARSAPYRQLNFNIQAFHGGAVNYNPAPGNVPALLHQESVQALVTVQPVQSLTVDNTYLLDREHDAATGADVYENQTLRTKLNYQFTQALSARVIVEYDSVLVNPALTSLQRTKQVSTEALLTWLPHPGTAIYLGYNNDLQNYDRTICQRMATGRCDPGQPILSRSSNFLNDGRQFFLKASYLWRF
jgi:hypothetical protein